MYRNRLLIIIIVAPAVFFASCKTPARVISVSSGSAVTEEYINRYSSLAVSEMKRTGIPASITLAQGMIESDYGRSRLAVEGNNHFGIKCHSDWNGPAIRHDDDRRNECFRKYRNVEDSFRDHSDFLRKGSRYSSLFSLDPTDYKGWARGLKKAGYATNPRYAEMLIAKIEENNLSAFDTGKRIVVAESMMQGELISNPDNNVKPNNNAVSNTGNIYSSAERLLENNRIKYIIVKEGDTRESLEKEFRLLRWELERYNELPSAFNLSPGQILYLQPKRKRAEPGINHHTVAEGETIYTIAQKYGILTSSLMELNRLKEGEEPVPGTVLWLRTPAPVR